MPISRSQVALNAIQWIHLPAPDGTTLWLYGDPAWVAEQPKVHKIIKDAGYSAVMMEVLATQTLQSYKRMIDESGLAVAPGYIQIHAPSTVGKQLTKGTADWVHHFDLVRRRAEESNFMGLDTVFLAAPMNFTAPRVAEAAAVGAAFNQDVLDEQVEYLAYAAELLASEGIRAGFHNHVGSLVETEYEIDYVMSNIDAKLLGASFDVGHLQWAGIDAPTMIRKYRDRMVDLHIKDLNLEIAKDSRENPRPYFKTAYSGVFLEPGLGQVDLPAVIDALGDDFTGWIEIEVDVASMDPTESAKVSWSWVEKTFPA